MTPRDERIEDILGRIMVAAKVDAETWELPMNSAIHNVMIDIGIKLQIFMAQGGRKWRTG